MLPSEPQPPPGGCVVTLLLFAGILFLSLTLAAPPRRVDAAQSSFIEDTHDTSIDSAGIP